MTLTDEDALRAYAKTMNTLSIEPLEKVLAENFHYSSQHVFSELTSKAEFLDYLEPKLTTIIRSGATVYAELGTVFAYGRQQPCVVLAQGDQTNLVALVLAKVESGQLSRLDLCILPTPDAAQRSGEYPR